MAAFHIHICYFVFVLWLTYGACLHNFQSYSYNGNSSTSDKTWYFLTTDLQNYTVAKEKCQIIPGGYLSLPKDVNQNRFLFETTRAIRAGQEVEGSWIGGITFYGSDDLATEGLWVDRNGNSLSYTEWARGEPNGNRNENCVGSGDNSLLNFHFHGEPVWTDTPCSSVTGYTCQVDMAATRISEVEFICPPNICPLNGTEETVSCMLECARLCLLQSSCWSYRFSAADGRCLLSQDGSLINFQHETSYGINCCHRAR